MASPSNSRRLTLGIVNKFVDDIILVDEESIASAVMDLMEWDHMLAGGQGPPPSLDY